MNLSELEDFEQAVALAEDNQLGAAHAILNRLRVNHPANSRVLICYAFTATDLEEAHQALYLAAQADPSNPSLPSAWRWLAQRENRRIPDRLAPLLETADTGPLVELYGPSTLPPVVVPTVPSPVREHDWLSWLGWSMVGLALLIGLTALLWPHPLNSAEKEYWQVVASLNEQTAATDRRIQEIVQHPGPAYREELSGQLQNFGRLNRQFRALRSPSPRFDQTDSFLGLAYDQFDQAATLITKGLQNGDRASIAQGNQALARGNDFLHQARATLEELR